MNTQHDDRGDYRFVLGLLAGTVAGAGLMMWLAPRAAAELRERAADAAQRLGERATAQANRAGARVGEVTDELARTGREVRDEVAGAVVRGAQKVERGAQTVERFATAAKSERAV